MRNDGFSLGRTADEGNDEQNGICNDRDLESQSCILHGTAFRVHDVEQINKGRETVKAKAGPARIGGADHRGATGVRPRSAIG